MKKKIVSLAAAAMFLSVMVSSAAFAETVDAIAEDAIVDIIAEENKLEGDGIETEMEDGIETEMEEEGSVSETTDGEETVSEEIDGGEKTE